MSNKLPKSCDQIGHNFEYHGLHQIWHEGKWHRWCNRCKKYIPYEGGNKGGKKK